MDIMFHYFVIVLDVIVILLNLLVMLPIVATPSEKPRWVLVLQWGLLIGSLSFAVISLVLTVLIMTSGNLQ